MRQLQTELHECVLEAHAPKITMDYLKYLNSNYQALTQKDCPNFELACNWMIAAQKSAEADNRRGYKPWPRGRGLFATSRRPFREGRNGRSDRYEDMISEFDKSFPQKREQP